MSKIPFVTLNNGVKMPQIGLGTWHMREGGEVEQAVSAALEAGYRLIDTAMIYGNEAGVGQAVKSSKLPRKEIFITTKLCNSDQGYESAKRAFHDSLNKLKLDYVDLYLIHWPGSNSIESWKALEELYKEGLIKAIGVSNFEPNHLDELIDNSNIAPAVDQIELHPRLVQKSTRDYCKDKMIQVESWSPLMQGGKSLENVALIKLAQKYNKSPAQIILRWHIQNKLVVIPKSSNPTRIRENIDIFDFELSAEDMGSITNLDSSSRIGPKPGSF